jgi:hypothetical protein
VVVPKPGMPVIGIGSKGSTAASGMPYRWRSCGEGRRNGGGERRRASGGRAGGGGGMRERQWVRGKEEGQAAREGEGRQWIGVGRGCLQEQGCRFVSGRAARQYTAKALAQ